MLLADLGAEVIKVERPGRRRRHPLVGPALHAEPSARLSTYFAAVNRGKRSVAIDLAARARPRAGAGARDDRRHPDRELPPRGRRTARPRLRELAAANPGLVYASINGFGSHGPRAQDAGTEVIVEAQTGLMAMMGTPDGPPVRFGVAMVDIATGIALVCGVLAALLERERSGRGRELEFPLYATAFSCLATVIASASVTPRARTGAGAAAIRRSCPTPRSRSRRLRRPRRDQRADVGAALRRARPRRAASPTRARGRTRRRVGNRAFVDARSPRRSSARSTERRGRERLNRAGVLVAPVRNAAARDRRPAGRRARAWSTSSTGSASPARR